MNRLYVSIATVVLATNAIAGFTPSPADAERFAAGIPVTNEQKTVEYKKFGKIKAKEAVVTDITHNVLKKGENVWSEDLDPEWEPVDNLWGYMIKHTNDYSDVTSWYLISNGGQEYLSLNPNNGLNNDSHTYHGFVKNANVSNVPFQEGTNKTGRAIYNADGTIRLWTPKLTLPTTNQCYVTEKGLDIFASRKWVRALMIKLTGKTAAEVDAAISALAD